MDKGTAYTIDFVLIVLIVASILFGDWDYILSDEGNWILILVGTIYLVFVITIVLVTRAASKPKEKTPVSAPTSSELSPEGESRMKFYRTLMLIFMWVGVILIVVSVTAFEPGEGVMLNIIGSVCMVITLILFLLWNNEKKKFMVQ